MKKVTNIAVMVALFAACWVAAGLLLNRIGPSAGGELARWVWALGTLVVTSLSQMAWKVHDAKRVEGLDAEQRGRVRRVAGLIALRIYLVVALAFIASALGIGAGLAADETAGRLLAQVAIGVILGCSVLWLVWMPMMQLDIQRFEDRARELLARRRAAAELAERLKKISPTSSV